MTNRCFSFALTLGLLASVSQVACKKRSYNSGVFEAPGTGDKPELLGLPPTMSWASLKDIKGGERTVPWTDTYWPLFQRGMAIRWAVPENGAAGLTKLPETPFQQVSQMMSAWEKNDPNQLNLLSPAEKYDLLKLGKNVPNAEVMKALKENEDLFQNSPDLKAARANLDSMLSQQQKFSAQAEMLMREINTLISKVRDDNSAIINIKSLVKDPRTRDRLGAEEAAQRVAALQNSVQLSLSQIKTSQAKLEKLEFDTREFVNRSKEVKSAYDKALKEYQKKTVVVAQKMASNLNMLSTGWENFLTYSSSFEEDWEWMGHCHGWAPAALNEATPKHGVLARRAGKEIFFTEGDVRGLLTKVYSDQAPQAKFASQRCNSDKLIKDRLGRVADGKLCIGDSNSQCTQSDKGEIVHIAVGQSQRGLTVLSSKVNDDNPRVAVWTGGSGEDSVQVAVYPDMATFSKYLPNIRARDYTGSQRGILNISTACRDTNPMTLHMALKGLINDQKVGFVMDRTRTAQVWNQPVHKWAMTPVPIKKNDKDGTLVPGGEPVPLAEVDDLFKDYRAKGTAFLVQMKVKLHYGVENGPMLSYRPADEAVDVDTVFYTLELDQNQNLIGGEWGLIPTSENARESSLAAGRSGTAPDFLWLIDKNQKPSKGKLDFNLIDKIHQCSLSTTDIQKYPWSLNGASLDYTVCNLD
ncbi:MAG: hypothetical protein ACO3A4_02130 [Silvanigrellaceae bacterium]